MADYPLIGGPRDGNTYEDKGTPPKKIELKDSNFTGVYWYDGRGKYHWREATWKGHDDDLAA